MANAWVLEQIKILTPQVASLAAAFEAQGDAEIAQHLRTATSALRAAIAELKAEARDE